MTVYARTPDGLIVPFAGSDFNQASAALRAYDDELRLVVQGPDEHGPQSWRVYRYAGSERPIQFVCGWWNDQLDPYSELSADGLLDLVKRLDRNTRSEAVDMAVANERLVQERRRDARESFAEIAKEFSGRLEGKRSSPLPRSRNLQLARQRQRAGNPSLYE